MHGETLKFSLVSNTACLKAIASMKNHATSQIEAAFFRSHRAHSFPNMVIQNRPLTKPTGLTPMRLNSIVRNNPEPVQPLPYPHDLF